MQLRLDGPVDGLLHIWASGGVHVIRQSVNRGKTQCQKLQRSLLILRIGDELRSL